MNEVRQQADYEKIIVKLQDKLYQNTLKLRQINSELQQLQQKNQELVNEVENSNDLNEKLIIQKELRDNEYSELKKNFDKLQDAYDVINAELSVLKKNDGSSAVENEEYFEEKELELNLRIEELIEELDKYREYKNRFEEVNLELIASYELIESLKEQQETSVSYIEIIEGLTDKNLGLNTEISNLKKNISELEDLRALSNDLENFHKLSINELNLEIENQVNIIHGLEERINGYVQNEQDYERLISSLKSRIMKFEKNGNADNEITETSIIIDGKDEIVLLREEIESLEKDKKNLDLEKEYFKFQVSNTNRYVNELLLFINKNDFQNMLRIIKFDNFLNSMIFKLKDSNIFGSDEDIFDNDIKIQKNFLIEFFKLLKFYIRYSLCDLIKNHEDNTTDDILLNSFFEKLIILNQLSKIEDIVEMIFSSFEIDNENDNISKLQSLINYILKNLKYFNFKNLQIYKMSQILDNNYLLVADLEYELDNPNELLKKLNNNGIDNEPLNDKMQMSLAEMCLESYKFLNKNDFENLNMTIIEKNKLINKLNLKNDMLNEKLVAFNENLQVIKNLQQDISTFKKSNLQLSKKLNDIETLKSQKMAYKEDLKFLQVSYLVDKLNTYQDIISKLVLSLPNRRFHELDNSNYDWLLTNNKPKQVVSLKNYNTVKSNLSNKLVGLCNNVKILKFDDNKTTEKNMLKFRCMKDGSYIARMDEDFAIYREVKRKIISSHNNIV